MENNNEKRIAPIRYVIGEIIGGHIVIDEHTLYGSIEEVERYLRKKINNDPIRVYTFLPYMKIFFGEKSI